MLNYGYAVVRAGIARDLAAQGFHPALGLHHDSVENAFNLADDLIEPFRPLVDLAVVRRLEQRAEKDGAELTVDDRRALARETGRKAFALAALGRRDALPAPVLPARKGDARHSASP